MATRHLSAATLPVPLSFACSACSSHCFSSSSFFLFARLSIISHCPLPPIDVRHFVVSSPKKIYVCHFTVVGLPGNSGNAKLLCSPNCAQVTPGLRESERERPSGSGKWERARAKRARYNDAWLPRQQRQRQRNGDCDCGCRCCCCCCY